ncbi:alpha/beta fold hydrolase [Streptomyces roseus]|uniref:alpha/beta fold hydrolase n=1 Tax=Streptomyces roseus TaxID=66430 RepID=UPI0033C504CC
MILVSGYLGWKEDFLPVLPLLAEGGYHAYAYDHRGQHESPGPAGPEAYTLDTLAADLAQIVQQVSCPQSVHLVGLCMGASVARLAAARSVEKVRTLTLVAATLGTSLTQRLQLRAAATASRFVEPKSVARAVLAHWDRPSPRRGAAAGPDQGTQARLPGTSADHLLGLARSWPRAEHRQHKAVLPGVPALLIHGAKDSLYSADQYVRAAEVLEAPIVALPRAGHCVHLHQPRAFTQTLLNFWRGLDG